MGIHLAFACGLHRRFGWRAVAMSAAASSVPDWDGLTMPLNLQWFEAGHRLRGHNVFAILCLAVLLAWSERQLDWLGTLRKWFARCVKIDAPGVVAANPSKTPMTSGAMALVAFVAQGLHLVCDMIVSGGRGLPPWEIRPWWPVSNAGYVLPWIPWGDPGPTIVLMAGIIYAAWNPQNPTRVSLATLAAQCAYVLARGWFRGVLSM